MNDENPYSAPQADLDSQDAFDYESSDIIRSGKELIAEDGTLFPRRCVSCNRIATRSIRATLPFELRGTKVPKYFILVAIALGVVPLLIVLMDFDISFDWIDDLPFYFFPMVIGALGLWVAWDGRNRRSKSAFAMCPFHLGMRRICSLITYSMIVTLFGLLALQDFFGFDFVDYLLENRIHLYIAGTMVLIGYIPVWFHLRISGQPTSDGKLKYAGFGKEYLKCFPETDESQSLDGVQWRQINER